MSRYRPVRLHMHSECHTSGSILPSSGLVTVAHRSLFGLTRNLAACRPCRVKVKGSQEPMLLVTYDTQLSDLEFNKLDSVYYEQPAAFTSSNQNYNDEFEEVSTRCVPSRVRTA